MDTKTRALVGAHVAAFVIAAVAAYHRNGLDAAVAFFLAIVFADVGILGLWAALGQSPRRIRLSVVAAALLCFWGVTVASQPYAVSMDEMIAFWLVFSLPCATISLVLIVLNRGRRRLTLRRTWETPSREGFQFSIRHLFVATALVAVVLSIGNVTRAWDPDARWIEMLMVVTIIPPCFVAVELATFWAALGLGRPRPRLAVVIPSAFAAGLVPPFCLPWGDPTAFVFWSAITGATEIILAGTLLIVRSGGWRLCSAADERQLAGSGENDVDGGHRES